MIQIPLSAYPNQSMQIDLDGQVCTLHVLSVPDLCILTSPSGGHCLRRACSASRQRLSSLSAQGLPWTVLRD